jgi:cytochrome bd-type quinol oxidase subunit 2
MFLRSWYNSFRVGGAGMYKAFLFLHVFFATVWVGGMVHALVISRGEVREDALRRFIRTGWVSALVLFLTGMWMWHSVRVDFNENFLFHIKLFLFGLMVLNLAYTSLFLMRRGLIRHTHHFLWINLLLGTSVVLIITYIR